jgi:tRNA G26 N,N-dimethylase Trm1
MYIKSNRMYAESAQIMSQIVDIYIDRLGAHMHIYESIDKIPEICRHVGICGGKWSIMGSLWKAPHYTYIIMSTNR